jgi:hypothetical protein
VYTPSINIGLTHGKDFEQCQSFLRLLIGSHILEDSFGLTILSDDHGLAALSELLQHLGSVSFEIADRFDLGSAEHDEVRL